MGVRILNNLGSEANIVGVRVDSQSDQITYTLTDQQKMYCIYIFFLKRAKMFLRFIFGQQQCLDGCFTSRSAREERGGQPDRPVLLRNLISFISPRL